MDIARRIASTFLLAGFCLGALAAPKDACSVRSPAHTVALLELYTSEGCDSCPPADAFVRGLYGAGFSADQVVPLSLHVDYWDSLGWRDRFARAEFTQRQYWLAATARERSVYTPEVFLAGREDRDWRSGDFAASVRAVNARPARAQVELTEVPAPAGSVAVEARASVGTADRGAPLQLFFAVYESELVSDVKSGENRGASLHHGFVVRQWGSPVAIDSQGGAALSWHQPLPAGARPEHTGFVAFVENTETGEVLQALLLPDCGAR